MNKEDLLKSFLIKNPEQAFAAPLLSYQAGEIADIMRQFNQAADHRLVHTWVVALLTGLYEYRLATDPEGLFATMRSDTKTQDELEQIFSTMYSNLQKAEFLLQTDISKEDANILAAAIRYTKSSIANSVALLQPTDKLIPIWEESLLKEHLKI